MTEPLIELRGLDIHQVDGIFLEVTRGFLMAPATRGDDWTIAAAPGQSSGDRIADYLDIAVEGYVTGTSAEDWRANTDALVAVIDEDGEDPGQLVVRAPLYGLADGESAAISVRIVNAVEGPIGPHYTKQTWSLALRSLDPRWIRSTDGS